MSVTTYKGTDSVLLWQVSSRTDRSLSLCFLPEYSDWQGGNLLMTLLKCTNRHCSKIASIEILVFVEASGGEKVR